MLKYLLIIIINSYQTHTIVLEKFETKVQCETSASEIKYFNKSLDDWSNIQFETKCIKLEPNKITLKR